VDRRDLIAAFGPDLEIESFDENTMTATMRVPALAGAGSENITDKAGSENISEDEDSLERVPIKYEVCDTCEGKGAHVSASIDAHGITQSEWAEWDQEERESYRSGGYDTTCVECHGKRIVPEIDWENLEGRNAELSKRVRDHLEAQYEDRRAQAHEIEMGY